MKKLNTNYFQLRTSLLMAMTLILAVVIIQSCASDETGQQDHVDTTLELREEPENPKPEFDWGKDVHKIADKMPLFAECNTCLLYTSPSPRDLSTSRMPSSA